MWFLSGVSVQYMYALSENLLISINIHSVDEQLNKVAYYPFAIQGHLFVCVILLYKFEQQGVDERNSACGFGDG